MIKMIMSPFHSQSNTSVFQQRVPLSQFTPAPYLYPNEVRHMVAQTWQERIDHMLQRWRAVECSSMAQMFSWMLMECWERERDRETVGGWRGGTWEGTANLYVACTITGRSPWRWWMWRRDEEREIWRDENMWASMCARVSVGIWYSQHSSVSIFFPHRFP